MGGIANQLRTYQILTQENQNEHLLELFRPLRSQLEQGDGLQISQILEALKSLGQAAAEDLGCNKSLIEEPTEIGISGVQLSPKDGDDSLEQFIKLLEQCQNVLQQLINAPDQSAHNLTELLNLEDKMMVKLRRYKALCSVGLSLQPQTQDEEEWNQHLHNLFKLTYALIGNRPDKSEIDSKLSCAWVWEIGPEPSYLSSKASLMEDLSLRLFGVESSECNPAKVFLYQDGCGPLDKEQRIQVEKYPSQTDGVLLKLSKIYSDNLQGVRKTGAHKSPEVKLYRIMCQIPVKLTASGMTINFECPSLPFTVRSGSPQLWPYTSTVIWFIWTQQDVRKPDTDCPRQLKVNEILRLIQARILGAGLRLSNKALWDSLNEQEEGQQEYSPYATLPHKLTDGERKGWIKMIEERCTSQRMISRSQFNKSQDQKKSSIWTLVSAAVNTACRLKKYNLDRFFYIGLPNDMCRPLIPEMQMGDFIFRSSLNRLEGGNSKEPLTFVVIQIRIPGEVEPVVKPVSDFEKWTLKDVVSRISIGTEENRPVCYNLPGRVNINTIDNLQRENPEGESSKHYKSKFEHRILPQGIIISQMQSLSLNSSATNSPACSNVPHFESLASSPAMSTTIQAEEDDDEPVAKKSTVPKETLLKMVSKVCQSEQEANNSGRLNSSNVISPMSEQPGQTDISGLPDPASWDSLDISPPSSLLDAGEFSVLPQGQRDVKFICNELEMPETVLNDVLLSSGSENDTSSAQNGNYPFMSPDSMVSDEAWSPASEGALAEGKDGLSEADYVYSGTW